MNLAQFQIILQKINALDKNINMDGKISSIEKDLMKAYVSQLYEACVGGEVEEPSPITVAQNITTPEPTPVVQAPQPPVHKHVEPAASVTPPVEQIVQAPMEQIVQAPVEQVVQAPIEQVQPTAHVEQPIAPPVEQPVVKIEQPIAKVESTIKEVNERIATQTKTVADALAKEQGTSINDRLANMGKSKTFNDKFTEPAKSSIAPSAPRMVKIPDSIKHLDNSSSNFSQAQPKVNTPPPTPPAPVVKQEVAPPPPPPAPVEVVKTAPVASAQNVNAAFSLFDTATSGENAGKWGSTPIADLGKSIGLNDKISMIKELFSDDQHAFNNALTQLNNIGSYDQAKDYMMRNLVTVYDWSQGPKVERAQQFINLVRRRYK